MADDSAAGGGVAGGAVRGLRPYQREGVDAVEAGLESGGRGQLHAACGTGKTRMAAEAAARGWWRPG
jgi:predicted helicase